MILKDTFYTIQSWESQPDTINAQVQLQPKHVIFDGHFPGNPVTPGVVQMELIKELIASHVDRKIHLRSMSNCKFLAILNPETHPTVSVSVQLKTEEGLLKASAHISAGETTFLKLAATYS